MQTLIVRRLVPLSCCLAMAFFAGCGSSGPTVVAVKGTVTRKGQPVPNLQVNFQPTWIGATGRPSWGNTDEQGQYTLNYDKERNGAELGKFKVYVRFRAGNPKEEMEILSGRRKPHPDHKAIEDKYGRPETTPLEIEVTKAGQVIDLQLD